MRGISVFVFVSGAVGSERKFVATADVRLLRWKLAQRFPWLESALAGAYGVVLENDPPLTTTGPVAISDSGALPAHLAQRLVQEFINRLQQPQAAAPGAVAERDWVRFEDGTGERAAWVTVDLLGQILPMPVFEAKVDDLADQPRSKRMRAVLRAHAPFVAVVDRAGRFLRLLDRHAYLEKLAASLGDEPE